MATKASKPITTPTGELALSNVQILNTVRAYAPNDYQQRIPVATQGNISSVLKTMNSYMPNWDVFWNVFVGRIGRTNINDRMNFQNPLAPLKKPALRYGMTIQEVQTNLIKARVYDPNGQNVFGREGREPDIHVAYHTQDRNDDYELNIPMEDVLRGAFIEGESISAFWNSLVSVPIGSAQNDEYLLMRDLTRMYDQLEGFYNINVGDVSSGTLDEQVQAGQKLIWKMRAQYKKMKFFRTEYSPEGRKAGLATRSNRVIAMISADVEAILKVIVQAYAYNESNQDLIADEIIVLDEMPIEGCQALMIDEDWYQRADPLGPLMLQSAEHELHLLLPCVADPVLQHLPGSRHVLDASRHVHHRFEVDGHGGHVEGCSGPDLFDGSRRGHDPAARRGAGHQQPEPGGALRDQGVRRQGRGPRASGRVLHRQPGRVPHGQFACGGQVHHQRHVA